MIYGEKDFYSVEIMLLHACSVIQNSKIVHPKSKIRMASEPPSKIQMDLWMEFLNSLNLAIILIELGMSAWITYFLSVLAAVLIFMLKTIFWAVIFIVMAVYWLQGLALYMPTTFDRTGEQRQVKYNPEGYRLPSESDLPFEEYFLQCADGIMIHTWFIPRPDRKNAPTIIFFHGNAGNIGNRLYNAKFMYHRLQCNTLLVEYRGYGNSQGSPSEYGFKLVGFIALYDLYVYMFVPLLLLTIQSGLFPS